jgi:hypothetical protein
LPNALVNRQPLTQAELLDLRRMFDGDDRMQAILGPMEHEAFAREYTEENPWIGAPAMVAGIPAYTAAKALGLHGGRSPASINEIAQAYRGVGEGLGNVVRRWR